MSLELDQVANILMALGEPARLRLVALLVDGELTVTELTKTTGMSQPRVSRHLKILVGAGVLQRFREAHWVYYRLPNRGEPAALARAALDRVDPEHPDLSADARRLAAILHERSSQVAAAQNNDDIEEFPLTSGEWTRLEQAVRRLAAHTGAPGSDGVGDLLDVGTGSGRLLQALACEAKRAEGLDNSSEKRFEARAALRKSGLANTRVRDGDMYQLPYDDAQFDTVLFGSMLAAASDASQAIAEALRVLRVGGHLLVVELLHEQQGCQTVVRQTQ